MRKTVIVAAASMLACTEPSPTDTLQVSDVRLIPTASIELIVQATVTNGGRTTRYADACGGYIAPTVELYRDGRLTDTWSGICLADRSGAPVPIGAGQTITVGASVQGYKGATYRVGVPHRGDPRVADRVTSWAPATEFP